MSATFADQSGPGPDEDTARVVAERLDASAASSCANPRGDDRSGSHEPRRAAQPEDTCCAACDQRFAQLNSRLSRLEQQLAQLPSGSGSIASDPSDDPSTHSDSPSEPDRTDGRSAIGDRPDETGTSGSLPYRLHPLDGPGTHPADQEPVRHSRTPELPTWAAAYQDDDVDESVKDYVERLLQRMGAGGSDTVSSFDGGSGHEEQPAERRGISSSSPSAVSRETDSSAERPERFSYHQQSDGDCRSAVSNDCHRSPVSLAPAASEPETKLAWGLGTDPRPNDQLNSVAAGDPYAPRSLPPERLSSLAEMRQLANLSAKAAIRNFEKSRATKHAFDRLPLLMVGLSCGLFLLYFASTSDGRLMQLLLYTGMAASFLAAIAAAGQAVSVLLRWMATSKENESLTDQAADRSEYAEGDASESRDL